MKKDVVFLIKPGTMSGLIGSKQIHINLYYKVDDLQI